MIEEKENIFETKSGWLQKWTNYVKGYRRRWFVLKNDNLSYYRESSEVAYVQRGTINILNIVIHTYNSCSFVISKGNSKDAFYLKAAHPIERNDWVEALQHAKSLAINRLELVQDPLMNENYNEHQLEIVMIFQALGTCLESLQKYNNVIVKQGNELRKLFINLTNTDVTEIPVQKKKIKECVIIFHTISSAMINSCVVFFGLTVVKYNKAYHLLKGQIETRKDLEEFVIKLFNLISLLTSVKSNTDKTHEVKSFALSIISKENSAKNEDISSNEKLIAPCKFDKCLRHNLDLEFNSSSSQESLSLPDEVLKTNSAAETFASTSGFKIRKKYSMPRRTRIPDKPDRPLSLWGIMKNCIGKDLSKIPMPVNFSEPLSFLQRIAEDFTYSDVLDRAAVSNDPFEELAYLAVFAVTCYASTSVRTAKPFNPLLGETYEWDRTGDLGWRLISEQVSHHPPISAQHCESKKWTCWQEFSMSSKFRGKYLMIIPLGISHVIFHQSGNHYSWSKVTTTVNNIIIGKLWVDNSGQMVIINHKNSSKCKLNFIPYSMFRPDEQKKVTGEVIDVNGEVKWIINGKWDQHITIAPVLSTEKKQDQVNHKTGPSITAWRAEKLPEDCHKYYNFSLFACQMNEKEEGVAPSDSRNRPDQRLMEEGKWDEANSIKISLEEKQREARKKMGRDSVSEDSRASVSSEINARPVSNHEPVWFTTKIDIDTNRITYVYKGGYWEAKGKQNWEVCPNIYL